MRWKSTLPSSRTPRRRRNSVEGNPRASIRENPGDSPRRGRVPPCHQLERDSPEGLRKQRDTGREHGSLDRLGMNCPHCRKKVDWLQPCPECGFYLVEDDSDY